MQQQQTSTVACPVPQGTQNISRRTPLRPHAEVGDKGQVQRDRNSESCVRSRMLRQLGLRKLGDGSRIYRHHLPHQAPALSILPSPDPDSDTVYLAWLTGCRHCFRWYETGQAEQARLSSRSANGGRPMQELKTGGFPCWLYPALRTGAPLLTGRKDTHS